MFSFCPFHPIKSLIIPFIYQITLKSSLSPSQEELENRVHAITDNLIQKQTIIERLSTEKNSLSLQLERLEVCVFGFECILLIYI